MSGGRWRALSGDRSEIGVFDLESRIEWLPMIKRQTTGSVVCSSCGKLVGVQEERCWSCGRRNPSLWGFAPVIRSLGEDMGFRAVIITGCVLLYLASLLLSRGQIGFNGLNFMAPNGVATLALGSSGAYPIFQLGWWWTVLSAGWLHGSLIHIGFNMYWVNQLAAPVSRMYGPGRAVLIYLGASISGFALTSAIRMFLPFLPGPFGGAVNTLGASAAVFGWLGALVYYGRRSGSTQFSKQIVSFALPLFVFGLVMPGVDNWAHAGGFLGGYALSRWFDPLKPERIDHLMYALLGILVSAIAVGLTVLKAWPLVRSLLQ